MSKMYVSEEDLLVLPPIMLFSFNSLQVGDEALALEVINAAKKTDETVRYNTARKLQLAMSKVISEGFVGPPFSIFRDSLFFLRLVVLPGTQAGHRVYLFICQENQPLYLKEIWYSYARCFSPIDANELRNLNIPRDDLDRWREEILKVMEERNAPRGGVFFPKSAA